MSRRRSLAIPSLKSALVGQSSVKDLWAPAPVGPRVHRRSWTETVQLLSIRRLRGARRCVPSSAVRAVSHQIAADVGPVRSQSGTAAAAPPLCCDACALYSAGEVHITCGGPHVQLGANESTTTETKRFKLVSRASPCPFMPGDEGSEVCT